MPYPRFVGTINHWIVNPVIRHVAGKCAPLSLIEHRGRHSGELYRTPIMAFPDADGFTIVLTFGPEADWVRNVLAAGACSLIYCRHRYDLTAPEITHRKPASAHLPLWTRPILAAVQADEYLLLSER